MDMLAVLCSAYGRAQARVIKLSTEPWTQWYLRFGFSRTPHILRTQTSTSPLDRETGPLFNYVHMIAPNTRVVRTRLRFTLSVRIIPESSRTNEPHIHTHTLVYTAHQHRTINVIGECYGRTCELVCATRFGLCRGVWWKGARLFSAKTHACLVCNALRRYVVAAAGS